MIRDTLVSEARVIVGYTAPSDDYLDLIAHDETPERAREMATMSGCALVWLGLMGRVFELAERPTYVTGQAFEDVYKVAMGTPWAFGGACRQGTLETPPGLGDGIIYGQSGTYVAHVDACIVDCEIGGNEIAISVVAGGQRDGAGNETVKLLARTLRWDGHGWRDMTNGRPVIAVLDADRMALQYPLRS